MTLDFSTSIPDQLSDSPLAIVETTGELRSAKKTRGRLRRLKFMLPIMALLALTVWMFQTHYIPSKSMQPALEPGDQVLTMRKWFAYPFGRPPARGDIIVFAVPKEQKIDDNTTAIKRGQATRDQEQVKIPLGQLREVTGEVLIKRVVGLPGEKVEIRGASVLINGKVINQSWTHTDQKVDYSHINFGVEEAIALNDDEVFVVGDNLDESDDSRDWGPLLTRNIIGRFVKVVWRRPAAPPENLIR